MKKIIFLLLLLVTFNLVSAQSLTITGCLELNSNIRQGMKDSLSSSNVYALQSFLKVNNYMVANPTGYFGVLTLKGVKAFQKANNINQTGFVGPITRAEIKKISCLIEITDPAPVVTPEPAPVVPIVETPAPVVPTIPVPVVEDVILTAPNNSSLRARTDGFITVGNNFATVRGAVTAGARYSTEIWFEITKNPNLYKLSETKVSVKKPQRTNDSFSDTLSNLESNTVYYYRACASNVDLGQKSCGVTVSVTTTNI